MTVPDQAPLRQSRTRNRRAAASGHLPVLQPNVAGIDLGSCEHWVRGPIRPDGQPNLKTFKTTTGQLKELAKWLLDQSVESVAMESTSVYWIPVYELLQAGGIEVVLVNARRLHNVPGRKTDMADCQWLQLLHGCGLLRGSFRPGDAICRLRALHRQLANFVAERSRTVQWMQKALDQINVQVHRAVANLTGTTGMAIVRAIVAGERDPLSLAALRDRRCHKSQGQIAEHLTGNWRSEHLFNLQAALHVYDTLQSLIQSYETRILAEIEAIQPPDRQEEPLPRHPNPEKQRSLKARGEQETRTVLWRFTGSDLTRIDGIGTGAALVILTEVGMDLTSFPSEKHFVSWLRLSPRVSMSAGKPLGKKRNGTGATRIAGVLRMAAVSLKHSRSALGAAYRRIARHKGAAVAVFAIARKLAQLIYRMLRYGQDYLDIGEKAYEDRYLARRLSALRDSATSLGFTLTEATPAG